MVVRRKGYDFHKLQGECHRLDGVGQAGDQRLDGHARQSVALGAGVHVVEFDLAVLCRQSIALIADASAVLFQQFIPGTDLVCIFTHAHILPNANSRSSAILLGMPLLTSAQNMQLL